MVGGSEPAAVWSAALHRRIATSRKPADIADRAFLAAAAAIPLVIQNVDARSAARLQRKAALNVGAADALIAVRRGYGADIAAGAAVSRIGSKKSARPIAADCAVQTRISALAVETVRMFVGTRQADVAASAAVENVVEAIDASPAATAMARGAADVAAARSAQAAGIAVACLAGRKALVPQSRRTSVAERLAGVGGASPYRRERQLAEHRAGHKCPEGPQRLAARTGLGERLGEFVKVRSHGF
jgi:hypothetical protein